MYQYQTRFCVLAVVLFGLTVSLPSSTAAQTSASSSYTFRYRGPVLNTTVKSLSSIQIDLTVNEASNLSGHTTFSPPPQTLRLCGAGPLIGRQTDNIIQYQFISEDSRPACAFTKGVTFTFTGTLSADLTAFQGEYTTNSAPIQRGIFTTTLTFDRYLPLTRK